MCLGCICGIRYRLWSGVLSVVVGWLLFGVVCLLLVGAKFLLLVGGFGVSILGL